MGISKSPLAFEQYRDVFERALNTPKGIRIACASREKAIMVRQQMNYFRQKDRQDSMRIHQPDDYMYNKSPYDVLALVVPPKGDKYERYVIVKKRSMDDMRIEDIEDSEENDG